MQEGAQEMECMRPKATSVCGLKLLVYEALITMQEGAQEMQEGGAGGGGGRTNHHLSHTMNQVLEPCLLA